MYSHLDLDISIHRLQHVLQIAHQHVVKFLQNSEICSTLARLSAGASLPVKLSNFTPYLLPELFTPVHTCKRIDYPGKVLVHPFT